MDKVRPGGPRGRLLDRGQPPPAIEGRDDVEWVAAVDTDPERAATWPRFPVRSRTERVDEALETGVDAVIVGSTPDAHHALAKAALESGANVLCEKPFTTSGREAWSSSGSPSAGASTS